MKRICEITAEGLPAVEEVTQLAEGTCPVCQAARIARQAHKSVCGHGTFCRDGMYQLYLIPEDISNGRGSVEDLDLLKDCCELIITANECELSVRTAELVKASLESHYDEWYDHLTRKRCKAMECPACYTLYIDPALCNGCGKCVSAAPDGAVAGGEGMIHVIKKVETCDLVVTTGGVSVGDYDLTPAALEGAGAELLLQDIAIKPGGKCCFGRKGKTLACCLSGNPASALTCFYAVVLPALRRAAEAAPGGAAHGLHLRLLRPGGGGDPGGLWLCFFRPAGNRPGGGGHHRLRHSRDSRAYGGLCPGQRSGHPLYGRRFYLRPEAV